MKTIILLMLTPFVFGCAQVAKVSTSETTWQTMHVIDVLQTANGVAKNPHCKSEGNFITKEIIGDKPDEGEVYRWGVGLALVHYIFFKALDSDLPKTSKILRGLENLDKAKTVANNHGNGVRPWGLNRHQQRRCNRIKRRQLGIEWRF